jgi:hypothetical protein
MKSGHVTWPEVYPPLMGIQSSGHDNDVGYSMESPAAEWSENIIDGLSGTECFPLWPGVEHVELIAVPYNGQRCFVTVDT